MFLAYRKLLIYSITLVAVVSVLGCGDDRGLVPVSGTVVIDGQPLKTGSLTVTPDGGRPAYSEIDERGRFSLTTYEDGDGVVMGKHLVTVYARQDIGDDKWQWLVPYEYSTGQVGLYLQVDGPTDEAEIQLKWGKAKPVIERSFE